MSIAATEISRELWCAVVGSSVRTPAVNSYVYYFPQGHLENASIAPNYLVEGIHPASPSIPCRLLSLQFYSCGSSYEPFVKIRLQPTSELQSTGGENELENNQIDMTTSFLKVLSPSDASNGGGFSVPKNCADSIFPQLNVSADQPVQYLSVRDTQYNEWVFRHVFRGTPRRHLLTTGWSKFVNVKRLVAGDSVVFIKRNLTGELFVGIRRKDGFNGTVVGDMVERRALEAIGNAARGTVFEVDYYPRDGLPAFVVSADRVERAMRIAWEAGMRVKMAVPTDDSTTRPTTFYQGRIVAAYLQISNQWPQSPWRMLQVSWDDPCMIPYMNYVSPWEVECELPSSSSHLFSAVSPYQKVNLDDGEGSSFFRLAELHPNSTVSQSLHYAPFPATKDVFRPSFTELLTTGMDDETETETISTALNIGGSDADHSSSGSQSSTGIALRRGSVVTSFRLFGNNIQLVGESRHDVVQPKSSSNKGKNVVFV